MENHIRSLVATPLKPSGPGDRPPKAGLAARVQWASLPWAVGPAPVEGRGRPGFACAKLAAGRATGRRCRESEDAGAAGHSQRPRGPWSEDPAAGQAHISRYVRRCGEQS